jgi:hypothetical protein
MVDQIQPGNEPLADAEAPRWRPSRVPTHRDVGASEGRIVEVEEAGGFIAAFARFIKRPFVRLVVGLGIFILAAIVYDATVNFGDWTEKKEKPKATEHRGLAPVPETPDG